MLDPELWPAAVVVAIIAVALVARWLRGTAVEDPEPLADESPIEDALTGEYAAVDWNDEADLGEEEGDDEDELAPLGVSANDRLEFLERLAERGAVALLWVPPDAKQHSRVVQHVEEDGNSTLPVFTSKRKAFGYLRALGPEAMAKAQCFESWAVDAAFLVQGDFTVLINPATDFETELTVDDRRALAGLAGVEEREPSDYTVPADEDAELAAHDDAKLAAADEAAESAPPERWPIVAEPPRLRRPR